VWRFDTLLKLKKLSYKWVVFNQFIIEKTRKEYTCRKPFGYLFGREFDSLRLHFSGIKTHYKPCNRMIYRVFYFIQYQIKPFNTIQKVSISDLFISLKECALRWNFKHSIMSKGTLLFFIRKSKSKLQENSAI